MAKQITLREVGATFERRIGALPLKVYWREEKSAFAIETKGLEITYRDISPAQVKKAMEGLTLVESAKYKERAYKWLLRWEHVSQSIKFRVTLYVYEDGTRHFVFTTTW